jgi:hypothetical protein
MAVFMEQESKMTKAATKKAKTPKAQTRVIYHKYFCTDEIGESDGFFEVVNGKLEYVSGWFHNDAMWRPEYMSGLLEHLGVEVADLPAKYEKEAAKLFSQAYGID